MDNAQHIHAPLLLKVRNIIHTHAHAHAHTHTHTHTHTTKRVRVTLGIPSV